MVRARTAVFLRLGTGPDGVSLSQLVHLQDDEGQQVFFFFSVFSHCDSFDKTVSVNTVLRSRRGEEGLLAELKEPGKGKRL